MGCPKWATGSVQRDGRIGRQFAEKMLRGNNLRGGTTVAIVG